MSSFNSDDLFGSGSHQILVQPESVAQKLSGFVGADGVLHTTLGGRGRDITISGILKAATVAALRTLITNIEDYVNDLDDAGPYTLVDDFAESYADVQLLNMRITSPIMRTGDSQYRVQYQLTARQLYF